MPIVVSHVVTSEVAVEKMATLTVHDPSDHVMTSQPVTSAGENDVTSQDEEERDAAMTSPLDGDAVLAHSDDVITQERVELV